MRSFLSLVSSRATCRKYNCVHHLICFYYDFDRIHILNKIWIVYKTKAKLLSIAWIEVCSMNCIENLNWGFRNRLVYRHTTYEQTSSGINSSVLCFPSSFSHLDSHLHQSFLSHPSLHIIVFYCSCWYCAFFNFWSWYSFSSVKSWDICK